MTKAQAMKIAKEVTKSCGCHTDDAVRDPSACFWCIADMLTDLSIQKPKPRGEITLPPVKGG